MSFCPRCGAPTNASMSFCTSCGETLPQQGADARARASSGLAPAIAPPVAPVVPGPPPPPGAAYAPAQGARGPVGRMREPAIVILLSIVTFGIYGLFYWWMVSREVDEHLLPAQRAHKLIQIGTILALVGGIVAVFAFVSFLGAIFADASADPSFEPSEEQVIDALIGGIGFFVLAGLVATAGAIMRLVGKYRIWQALEADERARQQPSPLSAGLLLALIIIGWFVPFGNFVLPLIVQYMTQDHVNRLWTSASTSAAPPAAWR